MCFDQGEWRDRARFFKHTLRKAHRREDVVSQSRRRSLYFSDVNVEKIETEAVNNGKYLVSNGTKTIHKIHEFSDDVGASDERRSRWVIVESTSGVTHGYPITEDEFNQWQKETRECCK